MKLYQGWKVTFAGMGINFLVGMSYTWSIFGKGLSTQFGWSQAEAALPYTVYIFCYSLLMIVAGRVQDRIGPRITCTVGSILVGASFIISSFFLHPYSVAIIWGVLFGAGLACCFASATPAAVKWFPPERRGFITGIVVTGVGISGLLLAPVVHILVERGVSTALVLTGLGLMVGGGLLAQFLSIPDRPVNKTGNTTSQDNWNYIFRFPQFYLMWVMFLLTTATGLTFASHLTRIVEVHAAFEKGYIMVTLFALFNAVGRLVAGVLSDLLGRSKAMTVVFIIMSVTMLFIIQVESAFLMGVAASFLGMTYGGVFSLFPAASVSYFGEANFGFNYGLIFSSIGIAGLFPLLAGHLYDRSGSFTLAFILLALFSLTAVVLSLFLKEPDAGRYAAAERPVQSRNGN